jgi:hypothetical protein
VAWRNPDFVFLTRELVNAFCQSVGWRPIVCFVNLISLVMGMIFFFRDLLSFGHFIGCLAVIDFSIVSG